METQAYAYLRVSGRSQVEGDGFPRQRAAIAKYAAARGITIADEYRDEAISGANELADREALSELLQAAEVSGVKLVLIETANRLARDLMIQEMIIKEFRKRGIGVIAVDAEQDLASADDDPTRKLIRQVLGAVAEFEKSILVKKLRAARDRKRAATGRCEGPKPFGSLEGEQLAYARLVELYEGGLSIPLVAEQLNGEGLQTRKGGAWNRGTVWKIVKGMERSTVAA